MFVPHPLTLASQLLKKGLSCVLGVAVTFGLRQLRQGTLPCQLILGRSTGYILSGQNSNRNPNWKYRGRYPAASDVIDPKPCSKNSLFGIAKRG